MRLLSYLIVRLRKPLIIALTASLLFVNTITGFWIIAAITTIIAFWAFGNQLSREATRARDYIRSQVQESVKASRQSGAVENPRWWAGHGLRGAAAAGRGLRRGLRGLREHMRSPRPGAKSKEAREDARKGPWRRIIGAGVRASRTAREAAAKRRKARGDAIRGHRWRDFFGNLWPGWEHVRDALRVGRCWDCGAVCAMTALVPTLIQVGPGRRQWVPLCGHCRHLHAPTSPVYNPGPGPEAIDPPGPGPLNELPGIPPGGEPELAPATTQPAAIGAPVSSDLVPARRWAPNVSAARGGVAVGSGTSGGTHRQWMSLHDRLQEAVQKLDGCMKGWLDQLANVNPGETQFTEGHALLKRLGEYRARLLRTIAMVDAIEGPIMRGREAAGGPRETCDTPYHAG